MLVRLPYLIRVMDSRRFSSGAGTLRRGADSVARGCPRALDTLVSNWSILSMTRLVHSSIKTDWPSLDSLGFVLGLYGFESLDGANLHLEGLEGKGEFCV
jgi:hypothetical protein